MRTPLVLAVIACGCAEEVTPIPPRTTPLAPVEAQILLNEIMADNATVPVGTVVGFPDWVELYNAGQTAVDLSGWFLTDDLLRPQRWTFPAGTVLAAGEYLVVICDGSTVPSDPAEPHANFSLSATGEDLGLFGPATEGTLPMDTLPAWPAQTTDFSWARLADDTWGVAEPTPGQVNR